MWIKTQRGELVNFDDLTRIKIGASGKLWVVSGEYHSGGIKMGLWLGEFDTRADAETYFNQLENLLTEETGND